MVTTPSYTVEASWYTDTGTTDHITNDLDRLAVHDKYHGKDQIQTVGGAGMPIQHVGHSLIKTPIRALHLHNILHAPQATSIYFQCIGLHETTMCSLSFTRFIFLSRTPPTRIPLLRGSCVGGLYPMLFHGVNQNPAVLLAARPTPDLWHRRLGHPGVYTLCQVLSQNSLLVSPLNKHASVCNACQMVKSCQLPFCGSVNNINYCSLRAHPYRCLGSGHMVVEWVTILR
jgi:hypothetical protein